MMIGGGAGPEGVAAVRIARSAGVVVLIALAVLAVMAGSARAAFSIVAFDGAARSGGAIDTQAGGHPDLSTTIRFSQTVDRFGAAVPDEQFKDVRVDLPAGLVGKATAMPRCRRSQLGAGVIQLGACPAESQVGTVELNQTTGDLTVPLYSIVPPPGVAAQFGFNLSDTVVVMDATVLGRADGYRISVQARNASQTLPLVGTKLTLWGVPADPVHDGDRGIGGVCLDRGEITGLGPCAARAAREVLVTNATSCSGPVTTSLTVNSWTHPERWLTASFVSHDDTDPPQPVGVTGCERLDFQPSFAVRPTTLEPGAPTGLDVDLTFRQADDPGELGTAHLRDARVTLPPGMTINPSSADGLQGCTDAQLSIDDTRPAACPDASRIGTVTARTPLLDEELSGGVYLRSQASNDPASGEMFRMALVLRSDDRGINVKLPGQIAVDPASGQIVTTFTDNPQMPVGSLSLHLKGGPRAPLVNPSVCGTATTRAELTPWSGSGTVVRTSSFAVAGDCSRAAAFTPTLSGGSANPAAGRFSPLVLTLGRGDGQQELSTIETALPTGLLAMVGSVPLCPESQAAAGSCGADSRIGYVLTSAGAGGNPVWVPQAGRTPTAVFLVGPYKGAPYSLSIVVPAQAGPFDLGRVVVRAALYVDPKDAHVTAKADPMPTIVGGVPLRVQQVRLVMDRERFMFNPTSCAVKQIAARLGGAQGASADVRTRFQAADCQALPLSPVIAVSGGGKGQTARFRHPSLKVTLRQTLSQAHLDKVNVVLPKAFNVDLQAPSLKAACPREVYAQDRCSKVATVGTVKAVTPVFKEPLTGPAFLLQKKGQLPDIVMRLRNAHYAIDLIGVLDFLGDGRVITRVKGIPDAPITSFELNIRGGKGGSLLTRTDLCAKKAPTQATFRGQNGKVVVKSPTTRIAGCSANAAAASRRAVAGRS